MEKISLVCLLAKSFSYKRKVFWLTLLLTSVHFIYGQDGNVGINTTDPKTTLDVFGKPSDQTYLDGVQAPRLTRAELTSKTATYGANQKGAIIYITDITGGDALGQRVKMSKTGYYYFDGAIWQYMQGDDWHILGNADTDPTVNFIGTTNDKDVVFKRNGTVSGWLNRVQRSTAFGVDTAPLTTGNDNTLYGYRAGKVIGTGTSNTFIGSTAGNNLIGGDANIAVGAFALASASSYMSNNVALGVFALDNSSGSNNIAIGRSALAGGGGSVNSGTNNIAIGTSASFRNTTGIANIAVGRLALVNNSTGSYNIVIGDGVAGNAGGLPDSNRNIIIGSNAMFRAAIYDTSFSGNVLIGDNVCIDCDGTNTDNVVIGKSSGQHVSGDQNVIIGAGTGWYAGPTSIKTNQHNILIGYNIAFPNSGSAGNPSINNAMSIGNAIYGTDITGAGTGVSSSAKIGIKKILPDYDLDVVGDINASATVRAAGVALTSDKRLKKDIANYDNALAVISKLRPVQYFKKSSIESNDYTKKEIGFIAQEVKEVLPTIVEEGKDKDKLLSINYAELIPVLTKALQEQQEQIKVLQEKIRQLENK